MYRQLNVKAAAGRADAVVVGVHEAGKDTGSGAGSGGGSGGVKLAAGYEALDRKLGGALRAAVGRSEFSAARGTLTTAYSHKDDTRVYIIGLGRRDAADGVFELGEALRVAGSRLVKAACAAKLATVDVQLAPAVGSEADADLVGRALGDGLSIGMFVFDAYKGASAKAGVEKAGAQKRGAVKNAANDGPAALGVSIDKPFAKALDRAVRIGVSMNLARTLAATPPNVVNPAYLVSYCKKMASQVGLKCSVIDHRQAAKLGMGGLVSVGAGGSTPPALITLEYKPAATAGGKAGGKTEGKTGGKAGGPVLLVGKAVTFDTGGYSLKPADSMPGMKYDKSGGMTVIATMHAIASLKLPVHVVGVIPAAENMVSDKAYRPSDIVTFCNGVTAEITNTDAEGRVILADALAHATKVWRPEAVIDLATLTGGVVIALGRYMSGVICNNDVLRDQLMAAGRFSGERLWELPLWEEHRQQMKGNHADLVNAGPREASATLGAAFLSYFVGEDAPTALPRTPWAHLDIAAVADAKAESGAFGVGPTGYGVRLLVRALENWQPVR